MTCFTHHRLSRLMMGVGLMTLAALGPGLDMGTTVMAQTSPAEPNVEVPEGEAETPADPEPDASTLELPEAESATSASRFSCQMYQGQYTVMYAPSSQPEQMYPWAIPQDMGSAWPAERRCQEISARLESYRPDGLLVLNTGVENGYNTVCVTTEAVSDCRIVFTVPPGQDAVLTRNQVFENLTVADQGLPTQGVNTFADGNSGGLGQLGDILRLPSINSPETQGITLTPFLDPADGGTGARLTGSSTGSTPGRPLNPDNFR